MFDLFINVLGDDIKNMNITFVDEPQMGRTINLYVGSIFPGSGTPRLKQEGSRAREVIGLRHKVIFRVSSKERVPRPEQGREDKQ